MIPGAAESHIWHNPRKEDPIQGHGEPGALFAPDHLQVVRNCELWSQSSIFMDLNPLPCFKTGPSGASPGKSQGPDFWGQSFQTWGTESIWV